MGGDNETNEGDVNMGDNVGNVGMALARPRRRRRKMQPLITQLSKDFYNIIDEYKNKEDDGIISPVDANDSKHIFKDEA